MKKGLVIILKMLAFVFAFYIGYVILGIDEGKTSANKNVETDASTSFRLNSFCGLKFGEVITKGLAGVTEFDGYNRYTYKFPKTFRGFQYADLSVTQEGEFAYLRMNRVVTEPGYDLNSGRDCVCIDLTVREIETIVHIFEQKFGISFRKDDKDVWVGNKRIGTCYVYDGPHSYISVEFDHSDENDEEYGHIVGGITIDIYDKDLMGKMRKQEEQKLHERKNKSILPETEGLDVL